MRSKNYFLELKNYISPLALFKLLAGGVAAGVSGTILLVITNTVIYSQLENEKLYLKLCIGFLTVMGIHFVIQFVYQRTLIRFSQDLVWKVRLKILDNVRNIQFQDFNSLGSSKILSILTTDASNIGNLGGTIATVVVATVTILSCLIYLLWLSTIGFLTSFAIMLIIISIYLIRQNNLIARLKQERIAEGEFLRLMEQGLHGFKELKLDQKKSDDLFNNYTLQTGDKVRELNIKNSTDLMINSLTGQFFFFLMICAYIFIFPSLNISLLARSSECILIFLYIIGPAQIVTNSIQFFYRANVSLKHFLELEKLIAPVGEQKLDAFAKPTNVSFQNVSFSYNENAHENGFKIGPFNLKLKSGELVFISGGNGSGKSTFVRLLTGLYKPTHGEIEVNGCQVTDSTRQAYRALFSALFTDNFLFERIYGLNSDKSAKMKTLLKDFKLDSCVAFDNNCFSTIDLSYGQRKRLALATSLIQDKDIYVFDEAAANQDYKFKDYFYRHVLMNLRNHGKIVIVITHDEKYFHVADKHYLMEEGRLKHHEEYAKI